MRASRAAQRAEREAASRRAEKDTHDADRRSGKASVAVVSPVASASQLRASVVAPESVADHKDCEATIGALRRELVDLEERYDDLVLSRWMLSRKYEHALGRMRSHDPAGIVWLVEHLAEWERENEARRIGRLQDPHRELVRRRYEEEFERRLEQARRASQQ
ncbi:hypothetical protein [Ilumatobacter fluminis]|nr:hypothetical protein [Ilumatobacter fluminis]